jgi:hypothetical protein
MGIADASPDAPDQPTAAVLVAFYFPPLNVVAAQRGLRLARTLLDRYDRVYVIRQDWRNLDPDVLDHEFAKDALDNPRLLCIDSQPLLARRGYHAAPSLIHRLIGGVFTRLLCDPGVDWIPALSKALASIPTSIDIKVLVASGPPCVSFGACVRWAGRRHVPVILDYRDLWSRNPVSSYPWIARFLVNLFLERPINRVATVLSTVSHGCKEMIERDSPDLPVRVLLNSPDASYCLFFGEIAAAKARSAGKLNQNCSSSFRIVFTGQIYRNRKFAPVIQALLRIPKTVRERVEVHYFGGCSAVIRREFDRFGVEGLLVDHGMVSKAESVEAILGADLLLSLVHTESVTSDPAVLGIMTTKIYDYILSGNPILSIGPDNAEANRFARDIGYTAFYSFEPGDTDGLSRFLEGAINDGTLQSLEPCAVSMPDFSSVFEAILAEAERIGDKDGALRALNNS